MIVFSQQLMVVMETGVSSLLALSRVVEEFNRSCACVTVQHQHLMAKAARAWDLV